MKLTTLRSEDETKPIERNPSLEYVPGDLLISGSMGWKLKSRGRPRAENRPATATRQPLMTFFA